MGKDSRAFWPYGLLIFAAMLFADQYSKHLIREMYLIGEAQRVLPGMWFTHILNTGATWGLFRDTNDLFIWVSVIAFGLLVFFFDQFETVFEKISYALLLAGLWGNLIDRVLVGGVTDFIDLRWWPVFNLADAAISAAIAVFLLEQIRKARMGQARGRPAEAASPAQSVASHRRTGTRRRRT